MPIGTQFTRTDIGMHTTDTFLCFVVGKLGWGYSDIRGDLRSQLLQRCHNPNLAEDLTDRMMERMRKRMDPKKIKDSIKGAIDSVKNFELSPLTIAKIAYGTMGALATMAQDANDCGADRNRYHFGDDAERESYIDYMIYTYVCNGRVQPRYTGII